MRGEHCCFIADWSCFNTPPTPHVSLELPEALWLSTTVQNNMRVGLAGDSKLPLVGTEVKCCDGIRLQGTLPPQDGAAPYPESTEAVKTQMIRFDQGLVTS